MQALERSANEWERNAKTNPLWAVLTVDRGKASAWDADEFFATGRDEVRRVLDRLRGLGQNVGGAGAFMDFGCGVGRITRALMEQFPEGYGIDVSQTMIDLARKYSADDARQARYMVNPHGNLGLIPSDCLDFVYSHIVLQHVPAALQIKFIEEFLRVLKPGGVAAFQIPTAIVETTRDRRIRLAKRVLRHALPAGALVSLKRVLRKGSTAAGVGMDMNVCGNAEVSAAIQRNRCVLLDAPYTNSTDKNHGGKIRFMSHEEALADISEGRTDSPYLSQFFFVRK